MLSDPPKIWLARLTCAGSMQLLPLKPKDRAFKASASKAARSLIPCGVLSRATIPASAAARLMNARIMSSPGPERSMPVDKAKSPAPSCKASTRGEAAPICAASLSPRADSIVGTIRMRRPIPSTASICESSCSSNRTSEADSTLGKLITSTCTPARASMSETKCVLFRPLMRTHT